MTPERGNRGGNATAIDGSLTPSKGSRLRTLIGGDCPARIVGVHDGFSAMLAERHGFDALWASGLGISAANGVPDASIASMTDFFHAAQVIGRATELPVVADCDTGFGDVNVLAHLVRTYETAGIPAICIEDKRFPKRNSFTDGQLLEDPHAFATKISSAIQARTSSEFLIFARLESFVAGMGLEDVLRRAQLYEHAGADALVVHSKQPCPNEIEEFIGAWRSMGHESPVLVIPTTYPAVTVDGLQRLKINGVIYANQALRAAMLAIDTTLAKVASEGTTAGVEGEIATVAEVLDLLGTGEINRRDASFLREVESRREAERAKAIAS